MRKDLAVDPVVLLCHVKAVEGVTDVAIAVVTAPVKVGAAVVDAAIGDDEDESED